MRIFTCALLVLLLLTLLGCHSSPKGTGKTADPAKSVARTNQVPATETGRTSNTTGLLAGQVIDRHDRRVPNATIIVVSASEDGSKLAPIDTKADAEGNFKIPGLDPSANYRLEARVQDGTHIYYGTKTAQPPNSTVLIRVIDDLPPNSPNQTRVDPTPRPTPGSKPSVKSSDEPVSVLEKPVPIVTPQAPQPQPQPQPKQSAPQPQRRNPLAASMPGSPIPAPPRISEATPVVPVPVEKPLVVPPSISTTSPVPSCVLVGRKLDNFALLDSDGKPWEFRRDRVGKLVLLDFWHTQCPPCLAAIKHLNALQQQYGPQGLEIIGIAYEPSSMSQAEQIQQVQTARGRYKIAYRTLMGANTDATQPCPVQTQFGVRAYPTLKLIDGTGNIVWESQGFTDRSRYELEQELGRRLPSR